MTIKEAIKFCEKNPCKECPAFYEHDKRLTEEEQEMLLCCINLLDDDEIERIRDELRKDNDKQRISKHH